MPAPRSGTPGRARRRSGTDIPWRTRRASPAGATERPAAIHVGVIPPALVMSCSRASCNGCRSTMVPAGWARPASSSVARAAATLRDRARPMRQARSSGWLRRNQQVRLKITRTRLFYIDLVHTALRQVIAQIRVAGDSRRFRPPMERSPSHCREPGCQARTADMGVNGSPAGALSGRGGGSGRSGRPAREGDA